MTGLFVPGWGATAALYRPGLPEGWEALEQNGSWNLPGVAIALGIWLVVGLVLSRVTFRWIRRDA